MKKKSLACITFLAAGMLALSSCGEKADPVTESEVSETSGDETEVSDLTEDFSKMTDVTDEISESTVSEFMVTYMDEFGTTLKTETVKEGDKASFTDIKFATSNGGAYSTQFKEWDKPKDTVITEDTTFTASYYKMPMSTKVESGAIKYYGSLKEITLPEMWNGAAVITLDDFNFSMNSKSAKKTITTIHIPDSVTTVSDSCFSGCENLALIDGGKIDTIGESAFFGCTDLVSIDLSNLTSLGSYAFYNCSRLRISEIPGIDIPENAFSNCDKIINLTINEGTKTIGEDAFNCSGLTEISLPDSLESIGDYAFSGCTLSVLYLGKGITTIGSGNFDRVTKIYYSGTPEEFQSITLSDANRMFTTDRTWFYSETEPEDQTYNYYYLDADGNAVDWA